MKTTALTLMTSVFTFLATVPTMPGANFANAQSCKCNVSGSQNRQSQVMPGANFANAQRSGSNIFGLLNRHSDLKTGINSHNVNQMKMAWKVDVEEEVTHTPLVKDGRVYFADWGAKAYAVDAKTGKILWQTKQLYKPMEKWPWYGFAGTGALGEGMLFEASVEGTAYALDANTGEVKWKTDFAPENQYAGNVGALLYHDGLVYIPVQSVEEPLSAMIKNFKPSFQGKVVALDAKTGRIVWERQLVKAPQNGVAVWSSFALDPEMNTLFFTTGNNYTGEPSALSDSLVAVDAKTGDIIWARQTTEHDVWTKAEPIGPDYDFGAGPQLFEANVGGQMRKFVGAGQKSGIFWVFDRMTGEPVWRHTVGYGGVAGGIHAEASVGDGSIYVWSNNSYGYGMPPEKAPMNIKAINAATGKLLWAKPGVQPAALVSAGFLANDVYFVGSLDGVIRAYRASDGKQIWTSKNHPALGSSLNVVGDSLFFSVGVPKTFRGKGKGALIAYTANPQGMPNVMSSPSMPRRMSETGGGRN